MSKKDMQTAFAQRYPTNTDKIYFAKTTRRGATYCAEAHPFGQPAELSTEVLAEVALEIYKAGWQAATERLKEKVQEAINDDDNRRTTP